MDAVNVDLDEMRVAALGSFRSRMTKGFRDEGLGFLQGIYRDLQGFRVQGGGYGV